MRHYVTAFIDFCHSQLKSVLKKAMKNRDLFKYVINFHYSQLKCANTLLQRIQVSLPPTLKLSSGFWFYLN